jgi:hypothetical protein
MIRWLGYIEAACVVSIAIVLGAYWLYSESRVGSASSRVQGSVEASGGAEEPIRIHTLDAQASTHADRDVDADRVGPVPAGRLTVVDSVEFPRGEGKRGVTH